LPRSPTTQPGKTARADGHDALFSNDTGNRNTATGSFALFSNTTGNFNVAYGFNALVNSTGTLNIALGTFAGLNLTTGDSNIYIGNTGVPDESFTIRIGQVGIQTATYVAGIMGKTVPRSTPVFINANGQLGTTPSSARFKDEIKPMDKASEAILALKPVTFLYKKELDPDGIPQFGLVAEEVEKVNPDLVARDAKGEVYTVRYEAVNAMLLNEFLKEHQTVQQQGATISRLEKQIEALTMGLQKVSAQLEAGKPAQQVVNNP
jgi:hypothetical protein